MGLEQSNQPRTDTESFELKWSDSKREKRNHRSPLEILAYDHSQLEPRRRTAAEAEVSNRRDTKRDGVQMGDAALKHVLDFFASMWCGVVFLCCFAMCCGVVLCYFVFLLVCHLF